MRYQKVNVLRDETTAILSLVPEWEVALMEAVHGDEKLSLGELVDVPNREWPTDARSEFQRLGTLYGVTGSGDNAPLFVERVYGHGNTGVKALDVAMRAAREAGAEKAKRGRPRKEISELVGDAVAG